MEKPIFADSTLSIEENTGILWGKKIKAGVLLLPAVNTPSRHRESPRID